MYNLIVKRAQPVRRDEYYLTTLNSNFESPKDFFIGRKMMFFPVYNKYERYPFFLGFCEPREKPKRRWSGDS